MKKSFFCFFFAFALCLNGIAQEAKYIFYFIGDGMGPNVVLASEMYRAELKGHIGRMPLCMTQFPVSGNAANFSHSNSITDSSAAGTALASGHKTNNGTLGLDGEGNFVPSIAEVLKQADFGIGITTSVSIDHATPAAFYAHVKDRGAYYTIGQQLAKSEFDFFGGSTFLKPLDKNDSTAPSLYKIVQENGYSFARGFAECQQLAKNKNIKKAILLPDKEGLQDNVAGPGKIPYAIDAQPEQLTLAQITQSAIDFLSPRHDRFFLMVEGGAIDWACHGNDGATAIHEVLAFDEALQVAFDFYKQHPKETLILVTADHETGGLGLGNSDYTLNLQILQHQKASITVLSETLQNLHKNYGKKTTWAQVKVILQEQLGFYGAVEITPEEDALLQTKFKEAMKTGKTVKTLYAELSGLADAAGQIMNKKSKLGWTTHSHSAAAVPVFAIGAGAARFTGWHDNTDLPKLLYKAAKVENRQNF